MIEIFSPSERPYSEVSQLGIVVSGGEQRHIGILIKPDEGTPVKVVHLAFHHLLQCNDPEPQAIWFDCLGGVAFQDDRLAMSVWLETVAKLNKDKVPYGFNFGSGPYFRQDGTMQPGPLGSGLTCATFVLAVFRDFGYEMAELISWVDRPEDHEWRLKIIDLLRLHQAKFGISDEHIQSQIDSLGTAIRFRPEEAAAVAGGFEGLALRFQDIEPDSIRIRDAADECAPTQQ